MTGTIFKKYYYVGNVYVGNKMGTRSPCSFIKLHSILMCTVVDDVTCESKNFSLNICSNCRYTRCSTSNNEPNRIANATASTFLKSIMWLFYLRYLLFKK